MLNIIAQYGIYQGTPNGKEGGYSLTRAPVTYKDHHTAESGLYDYCKAIPGSLFLLVNETDRILVNGAKWENEQFFYLNEVGMDVSYLFEEK